MGVGGCVCVCVCEKEREREREMRGMKGRGVQVDHLRSNQFSGFTMVGHANNTSNLVPSSSGAQF